MKKRIVFLSSIILLVIIAVTSACSGSGDKKSVDTSLYERDATASDRVFARTHAVYDGSFRSMLTDDEKRIYDEIERNVLVEDNMSFSIDVEDLGYLSSEADLIGYIGDMAVYAFFEDHPEAFWINWPTANVSVGAQYISTLRYTMESSYSGARRDREKVQSNMEAAVQEIKSKRASDSRYDTVKAIHDYVCTHLEYNYDSFRYEQQTCAPIFGGGTIGAKAVCEGYAKSFTVLCHLFDIPCATIGSRSHSFNYVQMEDGLYYGIDCTWDDHVTDIDYRYFLVGADTVLYLQYNGTPDFFKEDFDHAEYWYYSYQYLDLTPFVYPQLAKQAYSPIELLSEEPDLEKPYSGDVTFKFRYKGENPKGKKAKVEVYYRDVGSPTLDENGNFELTLDTTLLRNGYNEMNVTVGNYTFSRYINVDNLNFEILDWGDEIKSITEPYEVRVKGYSTGDITKCKIQVLTDRWNEYHPKKKAITASFNSDGIATFTIDPKEYGEGLHNISVSFIRPGVKHYNSTELSQSQIRSFRVSQTQPDSGELRFWGRSADSDRNVGEWAEFTLKYDGKVNDKCKFAVTIDGTEVKPLRQGGDKVTDFFDKDGYCTFYIDVKDFGSGSHTVRATLTRDDGSTVSAENTANFTDGYFDFSILKYDENDNLVPYSYEKETIDVWLHFKLTNTSGFPAQDCKLIYYEDDLITCDEMLRSEFYQTFWDEDLFELEISVPHIRYGEHILKIVVQTPDGTFIEKNLPFRVQPGKRFYEDLHFAVTTNDEIRSVGHKSDFTLIFDTSIFDCKKLKFTLDDQPVDVTIPDNPVEAFDHFGNFTFTLDFPDDMTGEHTIKAELTKSDGGVLTAEQKFCVTDEYFEITNWPDTVPTLHRVYDMHFKKTVDTDKNASSVRLFVDGEYMGVCQFDEDGNATIGLNTAGLAKGEHQCKAVFCYNQGRTVERFMTFMVE